MLKIWLVKFSNGDVRSRPNGQHSLAVQEEWHIFGEYDEVCNAAYSYAGDYEVTYLRWVKS